jgi:autophagy-related protein 27
LKTSESHPKGGLQLVLRGGVYDGKSQKAIIDFICDEDKEGTEAETTPKDEYKSESLRKRDDGEKKEGTPKDGEEIQDKKDGAALVFGGYRLDGDMNVLKLTWSTKHVCGKSAGGDDDPGSSASWGFFTWLVVL